MLILPTIRDLLRGNRGSQSRVMIRLVAPCSRWLCYEFLRIRLSRNMLAGGEHVRLVSRTTWAFNRGVLRVDIAPEWIANPGDDPRQQLVRQFCLVLDRRYRDEVLAAVYRTAGELGEQLGVRIR